MTGLPSNSEGLGGNIRRQHTGGQPARWQRDAFSAEPRGATGAACGGYRMCEEASDGGLYIVDQALHRPADLTGELSGKDKDDTVEISGALRPLPAQSTSAAVVEVVSAKRVRDGCGGVPYAPFIVIITSAGPRPELPLLRQPGKALKVQSVSLREIWPRIPAWSTYTISYRNAR